MNESIIDRTADQAVGFLRVFHVIGKRAGVVHWRHDVAARDENHACDLAREFILTSKANILHDVRGDLRFSAERARMLSEPYGWIIGVRDPKGEDNG
jgi:hypothetical protein